MATDTRFWRCAELPFAESRRACASRACYRPHTHPTLSIGCVDAGSSLFTAAGTTTPIATGTVVHVPPECLHACNPAPGAAWSYQMLHLDAAWVDAVRREAGFDAPAGRPESAAISTRPADYAHFRRLNALLFSAAGPREKEAALIEFIGARYAAHVCRIGGAPVGAAARRGVHKAQQRLREDCAADLPLAELAQAAGMSRYQLIRAFRAATGLTPHAWQLNLRIQHARARLRAGDDLAELAYRLGFADQSHFQRVFKAHVGVTPGRYRA
ncbi:AraC family transcriptional regulator [Pseudothauera rhizosphaerae]|uniref:AraC family transcriptional regulator n=1 Tax=Pseudothauera rhizosphaerae TaxID=2565932 RepID=A0A4S4ASE8_9RHOO|nr:AraC family transcriptional regulator [Pseudothauera rhizosphaerae]THF62098.1 AraC family transcriptional regulator [Pseudothauera rhizosphaerae]